MNRLALLVSLVAAAWGGPTLRAAAAPAGPHATRNVAIVLYDGVEVLDFAGPSEVFAAAAGFGATARGDAFNVYTVGATKEPLTSQGFVTVVPRYSVDDAPAPDIVVLPGGASGNLTDDARFMDWLRKVRPTAEITLTVCTGAFVLGRAGMLDDRDATTWYNAVDRLQQIAPAARVHAGRRFIDSGEVVTTAGVSAGIDGALHVVARLLGRDVADRTAQYMEYHWSPEPYLARDYATLNPSDDALGRSLQLGGMQTRGGRWDEAAATYTSIVAAHPDAGAAWYGLGTARFRAGDVDGSLAAFSHAVDFDEYRPRALYNLACLHARRGERSEALDFLERALATGRVSRAAARDDDDLASLREDARFRELTAGS